MEGQARTRLARKAIIDAAKTLFLEYGYAATTMDAISAASGVPSATVYRLFSSKLRLLQALFNSVLHEEGAVTLDGLLAPDHPRLAALLAAPDPWEKVAVFAGIAREVLSAGVQVYPILVTAAGSDPQAADLLAAYTRMREQGQGRLAWSLADHGALRPGLSARDADDIVHALASPDVYRLLVIDRGWSPQRYERWLAQTLGSQLLTITPEGEPI